MRAAYDEIAPAWTERAAATAFPASFTELAAQFMAMAGPGAPVLDLGCGPGLHAAWLMQHGLQVMGVDLSSAMLAQAAPKVREKLVQGDMCNLPFGDGAFGGVWCVASLLHLPKTESPVALSEVRRILHPGGALLLSIAEGDGEAWEIGPASLPVERYFAFYQRTEADGLLAAAGFAVQQCGHSTSPGRRWINLLAVRTD
jgi:ubiquinone/menaquinone biosynthesis C-methylase UbiE